MSLTLKTPPATEPLTLVELKNFLKLSDYADTSAGLLIEESILIATRTPNTVNGSSVVVIGFSATIELIVGTLLAGGTLAVKVQDSNDDATWADWYTFTQVTPTNDNQTFKVAYTGDKAYVRVVAVLGVANGDYAVNVILNQGYTAEDSMLSAQLTAAREFCEGFQNRAYITQVWELALHHFPREIVISKGNLITVDSITFKSSLGVVAPLVAVTDYITSIRGQLGRVTLPYGGSWPSFVPYPVDPIVVTFTCGYGSASAVPKSIVQAIVIQVKILRDMYSPEELKNAIQARDNLLWQDKLVIL